MFGLFDFIDNRLGKHHWYRKLTRGNWYLVEYTVPYSVITNQSVLPAIKDAIKRINIDGEFPRWARHSYGRPLSWLFLIHDKELYKGESGLHHSAEELEQIKIENKLFERNKRIDKLTKQE